MSSSKVFMLPISLSREGNVRCRKCKRNDVVEVRMKSDNSGGYWICTQCKSSNGMPLYLAPLPESEVPLLLERNKPKATGGTSNNDTAPKIQTNSIPLGTSSSNPLASSVCGSSFAPGFRPTSNHSVPESPFVKASSLVMTEERVKEISGKLFMDLIDQLMDSDFFVPYERFLKVESYVQEQKNKEHKEKFIQQLIKVRKEKRETNHDDDKNKVNKKRRTTTTQAKEEKEEEQLTQPIEDDDEMNENKNC